MKLLAKLSAFLPLALTLIWLQFLPDRVPLHYNFAGEIDRWGSKWEYLLLPGIALLFAACLSLAGLLMRRQAGTDEKALAHAETNRRVLRIVLVCSALFFTVLQAVLLLGAGRAAAEGAKTAAIPYLRIISLALSFLLIAVGNVMPKSRLNGAMGFRCGWSMYNETTWQKANRFGGLALVAAGLLTLPAALLLPEPWPLIVLLAALHAATAASLVYARQVYREEKMKNEKRITNNG